MQGEQPDQPSQPQPPEDPAREPTAPAARRDGGDGRATKTASKIVNYLIVAGLVVLLGVNLYNLFTPSPTSRLAGGAAPDFSLPVVGQDAQLSLADHRGKVVLLDFWATWCEPCKRQMPAVERIHRDPELADTVKVISVNTDQGVPDRPGLVESFLGSRGLTFTTVLDDGSTMGAYEVSSIPTLVVVDPDGNIAYADSGVHSEEDLRAKVAQAAE